MGEKLDIIEMKNKDDKQPIALGERGLLEPKDSGEEWRVAQLMLDSQALPQVFKNVPQVIVATQFLKEHKIPVFSGIRQVTIINGALCIWGDLPKALCDRSGLLIDFEEFLFDKEYRPISFDNKNLDAEVFGALCKVERKDRSALIRTFTVAQAKLAGLLGKNVWRVYPNRMLQMRARSIALKDCFPDILMGTSIAEYDFDILPGNKSFEPKQKIATVADEINQSYSEEDATL